ncbi:MAG: TonB-dependent receptor [Terracidiphilus sp.]
MAALETTLVVRGSYFRYFPNGSLTAVIDARHGASSAVEFTTSSLAPARPFDPHIKNRACRTRTPQLLLSKLLLTAWLAVPLACPSSQCQERHPTPDPNKLSTNDHSAEIRIGGAPKTIAIPTRAAIIDKLLASENLIGASIPMTSSTAMFGITPHPAPAIGTSASGRSATGNPAQPVSLFDALANHFTPLNTTVEVHDVERELETSEPEAYGAGSQEVLSTAGAWGDISRFLQVLPGVVATSDLSNEILVRGGHPMENLFLVDGIEIPNINHMAMLGTTGGFGPMIDAGIIQGIKLYTGGYDARYPERLSSVTEIRTLDSANAAGHAEGDVGIEGFGGLAEKSLGVGDLLVSAHHGIMNLMGNSFQMGLGGLPSYTNELARFRRNDASGDRFTVLQVGGWDSIQVTPCASDNFETSSIDSQYAGSRDTTGAEWQRVYSPHSFGVASVSDSEQIEHIHQQDQIANPINVTAVHIPCPIPAAEAVATPVYAEDSNSAFSNASYRYELATSRLALSAGSAVWLQRPDYQIAQPDGAYSPYSAAPLRADSTSFASNFSSGETGSYAQVSMHPMKALELGLGGRFQTFAFGNHTTLTPRVSARYSFGEQVGIHVAYTGYAQTPPFVYMLSYPQNRSMLPMQSTHEIVGMDFGFIRGSQIRVEAYNKQYTNIPASTEYPTVNLHDMVDMLGQQFVWLPMNSGARGKASGIELSDLSRIGSSLTLRGSIAYARAMFSGLDHISRPSNFDFPWILNMVALKRFGHGYEVSSRYGYATGRPYTPYDLPDSEAQNRPIYDVSRMNALRVPYYARLDAQLNKDATVRGLHLEIYAGVNNILNRSNFLAYAWLPRAGGTFTVINQSPAFPNFGLRYIFR